MFHRATKLKIQNSGQQSRGYATSSKNVYLVAGKRTPFGKFGESLKDVTPVDLTVHAAKALLQETQVDPTKIDHVIIGNVTPSTTDTSYAARHVALKIGAKVETPAYNLNRLCGSGIQAIVDAAHMIQRGEANLVLAGGTENMSMTPHLTYGARFGTRFGSYQVVDMLMDSLTDKHAGCPMAITAENLAKDYSISRQECDSYSAESHLRAFKAREHIKGEIAAFPTKKATVEFDEHIRDKVSTDDMAKLKPSFAKDGVVTPGTASGIVDGAATVFVASEEFVRSNNLKPLAIIGDYTVVGVDPTRMGIGPVPAIEKLLKKINKSIEEIDLIEINEAFAAQTLSCMKQLNIPHDKINIWGGAIAIGHPLGASGVRISMTLARQMAMKGAKNGIASACIGGGQGIALHLKSVQ
eukprot:TRINITY_DN12690_c0_g1_i1.p1 TRINITY_DN12690_c0_g1~~TRINITY_DN12690_c0_g1_i1.p1  ORF type:complete len:411 (+),score=132.81 TRINITY_DN12690_c0_g1_i1:60-1292(+)